MNIILIVEAPNDGTYTWVYRDAPLTMLAGWSNLTGEQAQELGFRESGFQPFSGDEYLIETHVVFYGVELWKERKGER